MDWIKKYPIIDIAVALIFTLFIPALFSGEDNVISGAMIQSGWCTKGNDSCLVQHYSYIISGILILAIVLQFIICRPKLKIKLGKEDLYYLPKSLDELNHECVGISILNNDKTADITDCWVSINKISAIKENKVRQKITTIHNLIGSPLSWNEHAEEKITLRAKQEEKLNIAIGYEFAVGLLLYNKIPQLSEGYYYDKKIDDGSTRLILEIELELHGNLKDKQISKKSSWRIEFVSQTRPAKIAQAYYGKTFSNINLQKITIQKI